MAAIDEILGGGTSRQETPPKGTREWAENNSGENAPLNITHAKNESKNDNAEMTYTDLYRKLNPYKPPTPEELEKEKKKQKRDQVIAAIGDGISALSNLFFTTKGAPSMYDGRNNMSEKTKVRYDKLMKEREGKDAAWYAGYMRAMDADRAMLKDKEERQRYKDEMQHRKEREKLADERYEQEQAKRKAKDDEAAARWQAEFDEGQRRADRSHDLAVQAQKTNKELREKQIAATGARAVRGKQLGFSDGSGNQVSIYENVWRGSMQQVFDAMVSDEVEKGNLTDTRYKNKINKMSARDKDDFVKQNWHKSPRAAAIMLSLSKIDPVTMTSEVDEGLGWGKSNENTNEETDW